MCDEYSSFQSALVGSFLLSLGRKLLEQFAFVVRVGVLAGCRAFIRRLLLVSRCFNHRRSALNMDESARGLAQKNAEQDAQRALISDHCPGVQRVLNPFGRAVDDLLLASDALG